jgi:hypothetical protein
MATNTTLQLTFGAGNGKTLDMSFPYVDPDVDGEDVKTLMEAIVENNTIFAEPPIAIHEAKLVGRTITEIELPEDAA